ncbi:MAG: aminotransferase class I/II-fold pyridoxal phosphate-dependent enzyme [Oscillospiraceae bacterium]|nr:aminotransferase class I/II-fold pyridoxal phosphate-dependent enzyme [Oscillospiraceae bacterium]
MYTLPEKLNNFTPYEPLTGEYKIRLDVNESFIEIPPEKITEAVNKVKLNRYPDPYANGAVKAFAKLFNVDSKLVIAGNGSDELIAIIASALLQKGDRILCFKPDFPMYGFYAKLYELDLIELSKNENMTIDVDEMIRYINQNKIKCVMFSNPCNPTSLGIFKSDVKRMIENTNALVVLDEAYMDFWDEAESLISETQNFTNLIVLRTCSKSVALAGIRLGFAVANEKITSALKTAKSPYNVNALSQAIGEVILSDTDDYKKSISLIKKSVKQLYNGIYELKLFNIIYKTCTNFIFAEVQNAKEIYMFLLDKSIAVRCFGEHLRICAGTGDENKALIKALQEFKEKK